MSKWDWVRGYKTIRREATEGIVSTGYTLNDLVRADLIGQQRVARFYAQTGLADFAWRVFWLQTAVRRQGYRESMTRARGFVIFLHGWDGNHAIWEQIPALVCAANPRLVALAADVNGFGGSPFADELPAVEACDPSASMAAVEHWIELLGLRSSQRATHRPRIITLVGHSMSGAGLFYLDESHWRRHEVARLAITPALLINDTLRKSFYKALGVGIWAGSTTDTLGWLKTRLAPSIVETLIGAASRAVKAEHVRTFNSISKGVLAQTFFAMGAIPCHVEPRHWRHFCVMLGHRDRLVGITPMLKLLEELGFASGQVRVILGDHYLFSVSNQSRRLHLRNRELVVAEILALHETCWRECCEG
ncbi:MAG: alpha/beta hydrolase [Chloroflexota bacterium]|nr:alpha/beta hydrolase [Chloroflexota bacterium]